MKRFFLVLILILAGCSTATASAPPVIPTPRTYQIGQVVSLPGWQITVTNAFLTGTDAGQTLLIVDMTLRNLANRAAKTPTFMLTASGSTEAPGTKPRLQPFPPMIAPGADVDGQLAWSVPITAAHFTLTYDALAIWPLTIK